MPNAIARRDFFHALFFEHELDYFAGLAAEELVWNECFKQLFGRHFCGGRKEAFAFTNRIWFNKQPGLKPVPTKNVCLLPFLGL